MRGGIVSRVSAALLLALARGVRLRSTPQAASKYAVTTSWFVKPGDATPAGFNRTSHMCCPLLLALRGGAARCRGALPRGRANATATVDQVLYVEKDSFGAAAVRFMESHGVRVVDIRSDAVMQQALPAIENQTGFGTVSNQKKLAYLWNTEYDAVLEIDYDVFFGNGSAVDMLGAVTRSNGSMLTFTGSGTPTAGGILAVRPSKEFGAKFVRAVQHGYKPDAGWGGDYPADLPNMTRLYVERHCRDFPEPCCPAAKPWCLGGADTDQGILFHLAVDGGRDLRVVQGQNSWASVGAEQYTLDPKPWRSDLVTKLDSEAFGKRRLGEATRFWGEFEARHSAFVEDVGECKAYYRKQHDIFRR